MCAGLFWTGQIQAPGRESDRESVILDAYISLTSFIHVLCLPCSNANASESNLKSRSFLRGQEGLHHCSSSHLLPVRSVTGTLLLTAQQILCKCVCACARWCGDDPYLSLRRHLEGQCLHCSKLFQASIWQLGRHCQWQWRGDIIEQEREVLSSSEFVKSQRVIGRVIFLSC